MFLFTTLIKLYRRTDMYQGLVTKLECLFENTTTLFNVR